MSFGTSPPVVVGGRVCVKGSPCLSLWSGECVGGKERWTVKPWAQWEPNQEVSCASGPGPEAGEGFVLFLA